jgi:hypothetical protein
MRIYDDGVVESNRDKLEDLFLGYNFPWYFCKKSSGDAPKVADFVDCPQLVHKFIFDDKISSNYIHEVMRLLNWENIIKVTGAPERIIRMKSNLLLKTQSTSNTPHIDYPDPHIVMLYYVNDSSGPTIFYNRKFEVKKEIIPKKGRILMFDGSIYHSSTPPITNDYRCVINFNLKL